MDDKIKELEELIEMQRNELTELTKEAADLKLEKDSLLDENEKLKNDYEILKKDNDDTKKLNYTLARNIGKNEKSATEILNDIF